MNSSLHRVVLCDKLGRPLGSGPITSFIEDIQLTEVLDGPSALMFGLDPADDRLSGLHTDGRPFLESLRRVVKYYRWERVEEEARERFVLRFAGHIWPLEDDGEADTQVSRVTCFDPLHVLAYRFARAADLTYNSVSFNTVQAGTILRTLVDRTNSVAATGLTTAGGVNETTPTARVEWQFKMISEAMSEMTSRVDIAVTPLDRDDGVIGRLDVYEKRGIFRPDLVLSWGQAPHSAETMSRSVDPSDACTLLVGMGAAVNGSERLTSVAVDDAAAENWMHLEAIQTYSDVVSQSHLDALVTHEFLQRRPPQDGLTVKPAATIRPWVDFNVGDTCTAQAHRDLRGGVLARTERIFGFTYGVAADGSDDLSVISGPDVSTP